MKRQPPAGDRVRSCRSCDYWCPMHGERKQFAMLGICARDGQVLEHNAVCSAYSAPAQRDMAALISRPCWKPDAQSDAPADQVELAL